MHDPLGNVVQALDHGRHGGDLHALAARQRAQAALGGAGHLGPLSELDEHVRHARLEPELALGLAAGQELLVVAEDDRRDLVHAVAPRRGRPAVLAAASSPGSSTASKRSAAGERHGARAPPPQAPATPDRQRAPALDRRDQRVVGKDAVEDERARLGLGDRGPQARREPARPAPVVSGAGAPVGRHVLDREAELAHHRAPPTRA